MQALARCRRQFGNAEQGTADAVLVNARALSPKSPQQPRNRHLVGPCSARKLLAASPPLAWFLSQGKQFEI
jgi:hypothetical protein